MDQEKFASFKNLSEQESGAASLDELYEEAAEVLPVFAGTMRGIVEGLGIDTDKYPEVEGERIVDDGFEFKALTCAPLKERKRAEEKIKNDYEGNFKCMLDLVRCSIIVETEEQLGGVLKKTLELGIVVWLKNPFANPLPTGIRDCLMNVKINGHICEVQLHLSFIIKEKGAMHEYYNFFRDKFSGASASYTEIMKEVEALGLEGREENVEYGVSKLLKEGDLGKLKGLGDIVGKKKGFGEQHNYTLCTLNNLANVYKDLRNYEKALEYYGRALNRSEKLLGKNHPDTLFSTMNIALLYMNGMKDYAKATELFENGVKGFEAQFGKDHDYRNKATWQLNSCLAKKQAAELKAHWGRTKTLTCSSGHELNEFITETKAFYCDICRQRVTKGSTLWGCRACDFDICEECVEEAKK